MIIRMLIESIAYGGTVGVSIGLIQKLAPIFSRTNILRAKFKIPLK